MLEAELSPVPNCHLYGVRARNGLGPGFPMLIRRGASKIPFTVRLASMATPLFTEPCDGRRALAGSGLPSR
jgi:hypothetical protein